MPIPDPSWQHATHLGLVLDLDGTLIPHAASPSEARLDSDGRALVEALAAAPGVSVAVVSGRLRQELDGMLGDLPDVHLVAEHGAWRRAARSAWELAPLAGTDLAEVEAELRAIAAAHPGAMVERKRWSVCLHSRRVAEREREALQIEATDAIGRFCELHPEFELLEGTFVLEVRHHGANKGAAVTWFRQHLAAGTRLLVLGDDVTDEDAFARVAEGDVSIRVGLPDRPTRAQARLPSVAAVRGFLAALARARSAPSAPLDSTLEPIAAGERGAALVVLSNRLPDVVAPAGESERARNVGGLVSGLAPALAARGGVWLGWSGAHGADPHALAIDRAAQPARAAFDFHAHWHALFYNGFANRTLWPTFHSFPGRSRFSEDEWRAYVEVNETFADHAASLAAPDGTIWAHDYHLLLVARALRARGHRGPLGLFLHIPFPSLDLLETLPPAESIVRAVLEFDLVGVHTRRYAENLVRCAIELVGARRSETGLVIDGREVRVGAFPLGIETEPFETKDEEVDPEIASLHAILRGRKLVLGVDRLDYTKGIVERLEAFASFLATYPEWRGKVTFVQVAVPSRADVPEYAEQRRAIETLVGRINGEHGEAHWVPVRYVYRSYPRAQLARLYRAADVGWVTPLRDGMNLVAKEYVAAQDPEQPGALVLSKLAGAAEELDTAILTNPYDRAGMARDLERALSMRVEERIERHAVQLARVRAHDPASWAASFLDALGSAR